MNSERIFMKQLLWKTSLIFMFSMTICSCIGKNSTQSSKSSQNDFTLGTPVSVLDESIWAIYQDNQGVLWVGTERSGVFKFNGESFEKFEF